MRTVPVGTTPAEIAPANPRRPALLVRNVGKRAAYLGCGKAIDAAAPVMVEAGGTWRDDLSWDAWWGCTDNKDGTTLALIEISR